MAMDSDHFDFGSDSQSTAGEDVNANWSQADQELFGPAWVSSMEHLETTPLDELMAEVSLDGFIPSDWYVAQTAIDSVLLQHGFTGQRLLVQKGEELVLLGQVLAELGMEVDTRQLEWHRRMILQKILELEYGEPLAKRLRGDTQPPGLQRISDASQFPASYSSSSSQFSATGKTAPLGSPLDDWMIPLPGKRPKFLGSALGITREEQERQAQKFWARKILDILSAAQSPLFILASESSNPAQTMLGAVGATRGSTMETYGKCFEVFLQWLKVAHSVSWPDSVLQVLDFLHAAGNRPCSPTYPKKFLASFSWVEKVGNWPGGERFSEEELVRRTVAYWTSCLGAGASPIKQAPRLPWMLLASLELYICDDSRPVSKRLKAWFETFKAWATLREDDAQHVHPTQLKISGEMVITNLMKSKTSGAAKRTRQLPVGIWTGLTLTRSLWLETGLGILDNLREVVSDFILPRFDANGTPLPEPMSYADSSALTQVIFGELMVPVFNEDSSTWEQGSDKLLPGKLVAFWTQHSPRAVVPTAAQILQVDKDSRNFLGRWSPGGSDEYGRGYRMVVMEIQQRVWRAVLSGDPRLGEHEILDRLDRWGEDRHFTAECTANIKQHLRSKMEDFAVQIRKAGGPPELSLPVVLPLPSAPKPLIGKGKVSGKGRFLIVYTRNRKQAKLHKAGGCAWTTVVLADCQEVDKPVRSMYDSRCKLCWPELIRSSETDLVHSSSDSGF